LCVFNYFKYPRGKAKKKEKKEEQNKTGDREEIDTID